MFATRRRLSIYLLLATSFVLASIIGVLPTLVLLGFTGFVPESFLRMSFGSHFSHSPGEVVDVPMQNDCSFGGLGIASQTFVISLPHRTDRRSSIERLRAMLSLNFTYIDALPPDHHTIASIFDNLSAERAQLRVADPNARGPLSNFTDGSGQFSWRSDILGQPSPSMSDVNTTLLSDQAMSIPLEPSGPITCASRNFTAGEPYTASTPSYLVLTPAKVACWYSHLQAIKLAAESGSSNDLDNGRCNNVTLILEDDIDMERDIHPRLQGVWSSLPVDWDIVYLGSCWSNESYYPPLGTFPSPKAFRFSSFKWNARTTTLHPSRAPKCTHAYALSVPGARKLLQYLQYPPFAYSRALDQALSWLILDRKIKSFTTVPSLVVQRKVSTSDIDGGSSGFGSSWKEALGDGVLGY